MWRNPDRSGANASLSEVLDIANLTNHKAALEQSSSPERSLIGSVRSCLSDSSLRTVLLRSDFV